MSWKKMSALQIGSLKADMPIVQGGMGVGISLSGLASAVANAGGIGVIATPTIGHLEPDYDKNPRDANKRALQREIRRAKAKTNGIIGVNVMVALTNFDDLVQCSVDAGADVVFLGAGLPRGVARKSHTGRVHSAGLVRRQRDFQMLLEVLEKLQF